MDNELKKLLIEKDKLDLINEIIYLYDNFDNVKFYFDYMISDISRIDIVQSDIDELFFEFKDNIESIYMQFKSMLLKKEIKSGQKLCLYLIAFIDKYIEYYSQFKESEVYKLQLESLASLLGDKLSDESEIINEKMYKLLKKIRIVDIGIYNYYIDSIPKYHHAL